LKLLPTSPRFAGFSRELALEENLAKRVMEEHRAKATMVFHRPRSGGSMEKIVPKGDFFHRSAAILSAFVHLRHQKYVNFSKIYRLLQESGRRHCV
ncbi:hypothetical protein, partial [Flavobacterium psychrophilum]|uniref:hypothetical protein n=1 Tax=Flavobacterium psychrophilum TaxID=96345 RepID=UPI001C0F25C0